MERNLENLKGDVSSVTKEYKLVAEWDFAEASNAWRVKLSARTEMRPALFAGRARATALTLAQMGWKVTFKSGAAPELSIALGQNGDGKLAEEPVIVRDEHRPETAGDDWETQMVFTKAEAFAFARVAVEASLSVSRPLKHVTAQDAIDTLRERSQTILKHLAKRIDEVKRNGGKVS